MMASIFFISGLLATVFRGVRPLLFRSGNRLG